MNAPPLPSCQVCGACCAVLAVEVLPNEHERVMAAAGKARVALPIIFDDLDGMFLVQQGQEQRCTFLSGKVGEKVVCRIYADRPDDCVSFERGSTPCWEARQRMGLSTYVPEDAA
jgi:Fe-S-cluster containining protein